MVLVLAAEVYLVWHVRKDILSAKQAVRDFVYPPEDGKPSLLAQTVVNLTMTAAPLLATAIAQSMANSVKGKVSGIVRGLDAIQGEAADELIGQSEDPIKQAMAAAFQRQLKKNPALKYVLAQLPTAGGGNNNHNNNNNHGNQAQTKMGF